MPQKQKKTKENKDEKKKILDELALSLRKSSEEMDEEESSEEESGLEEDIQHSISNLQFQSFMQDEDISAPVLERIAGRQAGPVFVGGISRGPQTIPGEEKSSDPFKYVPGNNANGEPKYIDSDSHLSASAERADFSKVGRNAEPWRDVNQGAMFMQSAEARGETFAQERVWGAERFDAEKDRRKNPMEREEAKYDKYKPDLPKSR